MDHFKALNEAAYAALCANRYSPNHIRDTLRAIAVATDRLLDDAAPDVSERWLTAAEYRARQMNAELPADQRDVMQLKGMIPS